MSPAFFQVLQASGKEDRREGGREGGRPPHRGSSYCPPSQRPFHGELAFLDFQLRQRPGKRVLPCHRARQLNPEGKQDQRPGGGLRRQTQGSLSGDKACLWWQLG